MTPTWGLPPAGVLLPPGSPESSPGLPQRGRRKGNHGVSNRNLLNDAQQRRLLASAKYADELLSEIEAILTAAESKSAFPKYRPDLTLHQARLIRSHIARFRNHLTRVLAAVGVHHQGPAFGSLHSVRVTLTLIRVAVQEMAPEYLRGYGELREEAVAELRGLSAELQGLLDTLDRGLALGESADLQSRLDRLQRTTRETELLRALDRITTEYELAEFRAPLLNLLDKLESRQFEIALFGRVSSGKSSLLNHILHTDVLPVGVNPITAVPTRIVYSPEPWVAVTFANRETKRCPVTSLAQYASEEQNPGNRLEIVRLVVGLNSPRLEDGLVLVDTPGLGALATAGAAETMAYLPQCDLGILLVSAANPVNTEDLTTIQALAQAGIPAIVLLSKADLLSPDDRAKALNYTRQEVFANLNLKVDVEPVSSAPAYEDMLENWFAKRLSPLCARHRELAEESIRRKAGALRDAVAAALESKLGRPRGLGKPDTARLEEIEGKLREAAGHIEQTRRFCIAATDEVRLLRPVAIGRAAGEWAEQWSSARRADPGPAAVLLDVAGRLAAEAASQISGPLQALARELDSVLALCAQELTGRPPVETSLRECVREMPRFEAALPDLAINPPWFWPFNGIVRPWLRRRLRKRAQESVDSAFNSYGRSLETWVRQVLANLQREFDARADAYRAQLARLAGPAVSAAERERLERDLAILEEFMTAQPESRDRVPAVTDER